MAIEMTKDEFINLLNDLIKERKKILKKTNNFQEKIAIEFQILLIENIKENAETNLKQSMEQYNKYTDTMIRYVLGG